MWKCWPAVHALSNFVLLNPAVVQAELSVAEAGLENTWRVGPAQLDSGHGSYLELVVQGESKGLRPLSPCQLRGVRDGADVLFTWIRRSRIDGDGWEPVEIPLGEEFENYRSGNSGWRSAETQRRGNEPELPLSRRRYRNGFWRGAFQL